MRKIINAHSILSLSTNFWHSRRQALHFTGFFKQLLQKCLDILKKRQCENKFEILFFFGSKLKAKIC
jgi:hypothetical protein